MWTHPNMGRGSSTSFLLATLSVIDSCVLLLPLYDWLDYGPIKFNLRTYHNASCKIFSYLYTVLPTISSYNLVILSIFRAIGIYIPHKYKSICTKKRAVILIIFVVVLASLSFVYLLFFQNLTKSQFAVKTQCLKDHRYDSHFVTHILPNLKNTFSTFIPIGLIFLVNISIISKLACRKMSSQSSGSKITITLIAVSFLYLITQTPLAVYISIRRKQDWTKASRLEQVHLTIYC